MTSLWQYSAELRGQHRDRIPESRPMVSSPPTEKWVA